MPSAKLPTTPKGWVAAIASSMVGFVAGLYALDRFGKWL